jgi:hypothetical protein
MRMGAVLLGAGLSACSAATQTREVAELVVEGDSRDLRDGGEPRSAETERRPDLLVLAIDGIDRDLLYDMLRRGQLPGLALLLGGGSGGDFPHAHLDRTVLSTLPSSTIPAWATIFTGQPPAVHGLSGNEVFVRKDRSLAAPAPVSFNDATPTLQCYTDDYADGLLEVPTVYEQIRARDRGVRIWVSMSQFHRGADRLLMARRTIMAKAFYRFLDDLVGDEEDDDRMETFASLDGEVLDVLIDKLDDGDLPDVLTVYLVGADLFAHQARAGPDRARRLYLRQVLDPKLRALHRVLDRRGALRDRFVVVVSDHGHTDVLEDERHALGTGEEGEPPDVLRAAGFRVREMAWKVDDAADFQSVIAYGGATAFVYLADRSHCPDEGQKCDFRAPARFTEDVLPAADAFFRSSRDGRPVAGMRDTIDLVLVRRPRPAGQEAAPFQVYVGDGEVEDVGKYLARHPRRGYVRVAERLRDLAVGPLGDRAGDILLISRDGAERDIRRRFYFSTTYESWHGSPARKDSEIPFILAHGGKSRAELARLTRAALGDHPGLDRVGRLLVRLRVGERPRRARDDQPARR